MNAQIPGYPRSCSYAEPPKRIGALSIKEWGRRDGRGWKASNIFDISYKQD